MSDDLVKRLYDRRVCSPAQNSCRNDLALELAADRIEGLEAKLRKSALQELSALDQASDAYQAQLAAEAKLAKAVELVERAFNEGFGEGMNDGLRQSGGKTWHDSRSLKRLAELKGGTDE